MCLYPTEPFNGFPNGFKLEETHYKWIEYQFDIRAVVSDEIQANKNNVTSCRLCKKGSVGRNKLSGDEETAQLGIANRAEQQHNGMQGKRMKGLFVLAARWYFLATDYQRQNLDSSVI